MSIGMGMEGGRSADAGGAHGGIVLPRLGWKVPEAPSFLFPWAFFDWALGVVNSGPSAGRS
jgi:hypothetical protein